MRLKDKVAVVVGAGQGPGEGMGNGRATVIRFAQEGAKVLCVDRDLGSAEETVAIAAQYSDECVAFEADVTREATLAAAMQDARDRWGRIDIMHYNVGVSVGAGDAPLDAISEDVLDRIFAINLRGMWLACKHAMPHLRECGRGSIVNISSMAAKHEYPRVGYKTTKAAVIALTEHLASTNARYNVRANSIMPGKINTPMAIEPRVAQGVPREQVVAARDKMIPLGGKMGEAWDVANAALFLHSDEAKFISGVALPVDGGEAMMGGAG